MYLLELVVSDGAPDHSAARLRGAWARQRFIRFEPAV
jgi:hypothetical protein